MALGGIFQVIPALMCYLVFLTKSLTGQYHWYCIALGRYHGNYMAALGWYHGFHDDQELFGIAHDTTQLAIMTYSRSRNSRRDPKDICHPLYTKISVVVDLYMHFLNLGIQLKLCLDHLASVIAFHWLQWQSIRNHTMSGMLPFTSSSCKVQAFTCFHAINGDKKNTLHGRMSIG